MAYLLDANVFIQAKNLHYAPDFCPAFWDWLVAKHGEGLVFSIEKVGDELARGGDELTQWAADRGDPFFLKPEANVLPAFGTVSTWANSNGFEAAAINKFLQVADFYLVAHALAGGHTVVTHEKPVFTPKNIKVPIACVGVGVKCVTTFEMLRREKANFVLGARA